MEENKYILNQTEYIFLKNHNLINSKIGRMATITAKAKNEEEALETITQYLNTLPESERVKYSPALFITINLPYIF